MVSLLRLHASAQCKMTFKMRRFWNGIFSFSEDNPLAKIDYNRVEARLHVSLKQRLRLL